MAVFDKVGRHSSDSSAEAGVVVETTRPGSRRPGRQTASSNVRTRKKSPGPNPRPKELFWTLLGRLRRSLEGVGLGHGSVWLPAQRHRGRGRGPGEPGGGQRGYKGVPLGTAKVQYTIRECRVATGGAFMPREYPQYPGCLVSTRVYPRSLPLGAVRTRAVTPLV